MGHTNSTTNYSLPQFVTTDKPAWLTDINGAFSAIDSSLHTAQTDATTAKNTADNAQTDATAAGTAASTADGKAAGAIASIADAFDTTATYSVGDLVMYNSLLYKCTTAVTTPGAWSGTTNWSRTTVETEIPANAGQLKYTNGSNPAGTVGAAVDDLKSIVDISNAFSLSATVSGELFIKAYYNPGERRVSGNVAVHVTSGSIATNQNFLNINNYRPATSQDIPMLVKTSTGVLTYHGYMTPEGLTSQVGSSSCTGVYFNFEYYI